MLTVKFKDVLFMEPHLAIALEICFGFTESPHFAN